jgi:hypothetical protein
MINEIISGVIGGVVYSLSGWQSTEDNFDWSKLGKSVLISGVTGAVCALTGMDFNAAIVGTVGMGVTAFVNKLLKIFELRFKK